MSAEMNVFGEVDLAIVNPEARFLSFDDTGRLMVNKAELAKQLDSVNPVVARRRIGACVADLLSASRECEEEDESSVVLRSGVREVIKAIGQQNLGNLRRVMADLSDADLGALSIALSCGRMVELGMPDLEVCHTSRLAEYLNYWGARYARELVRMSHRRTDLREDGVRGIGGRAGKDPGRPRALEEHLHESSAVDALGIIEEILDIVEEREIDVEEMARELIDENGDLVIGVCQAVDRLARQGGETAIGLRKAVRRITQWNNFPLEQKEKWEIDDQIRSLLGLDEADDR